MKRVITLPDTEAVRKFVQAAGEMENMVVVTKEGYNYQIDAASLLGMMALMGAKIMVECANVSDKLSGLMDSYAVTC